MSSHSGRKVKSLHQHALLRAYKTSKREFRRELEIAYDLYLQDCAQKKRKIPYMLISAMFGLFLKVEERNE